MYLFELGFQSLIQYRRELNSSVLLCFSKCRSTVGGSCPSKCVTSGGRRGCCSCEFSWYDAHSPSAHSEEGFEIRHLDG